MNIDIKLKCPLCNLGLDLNNKSYTCANNHSYDISKHGYTNLLLVNKKNSKRPGDNAEMVKSRSAFLNNGYYQCLANSLSQYIHELTGDSKVKKILDLGCGEGYYLSQLQNTLSEHSKHLLTGLDISKNAVQSASKRKINAKLFVGSIYDLPYFNQEFDIAFSIFAPIGIEEIHRVLCENGVIIIVGPGEEHLNGLTKHIYDTVVSHSGNYNIIDSSENFQCIKTIEIKENISVQNENILDLLRMTPYYWKTTQEKKQKILALDKLDTTLHFYIKAYKRIS